MESVKEALRTATAVFDGHALQLESPLDLRPNTRYVITIEDTVPSTMGSVWDLLASLTGTIEAPSDWASEHDHYLYGTPKRRNESEK